MVDWIEINQYVIGTTEKYFAKCLRNFSPNLTTNLNFMKDSFLLNIIAGCKFSKNSLCLALPNNQDEECCLWRGGCKSEKISNSFHSNSERKFHVKFCWNFTWSFKDLFGFLNFLISILVKILNQKPEGSGSMRNTAHFVKTLITYPIHEEKMLKSKYFNDS